MDFDTRKSETLGFPPVTSGGMGAGVSGRNLVREVSRLGGLGTLSSAGLRHIIMEEVKGGADEVIATARTFPFLKYVDELLEFAPGGKHHNHAIPMDKVGPKGERARRLTTICTFIEVALAKKGHKGKVAINVMWKLTSTVLPAIYGAMLADVDVLSCGAGVPMELADIVEKIRAGVDLKYPPLFSTSTSASLRVCKGTREYLAKFERPRLAPILSNSAFCRLIQKEWEKKYGYGPDFFILEDYRAGGHNAPARNKTAHSDEDDGIETYFAKVLALGVPIIVAGACKHGGTKEDLDFWLVRGAHGIQVGSRVALCKESEILPKLKRRIIENNRRGRTKIVTSMTASPSGYPLKRVELNGTLARKSVQRKQKRSCEFGYLRQGYTTGVASEEIEVLACPAMPIKQFRRLTGKTLAECRAECKDKACLCAGLISTIGVRKSSPFVTLGESGKLVTRHQTTRQFMEDVLTPEFVAEKERELVLV